MRSLSLLVLVPISVSLSVGCSGSDGSSTDPDSADAVTSGDSTVDDSGSDDAPSAEAADDASSDVRDETSFDGATNDATNDATSDADTGPTYLRGVNSENFLVTTGWGKGYGPTITSVASYAFLRAHGVRLIRLMIGWGLHVPDGMALQPALSGPLDATYVSRLHQEVANIKAAGLIAVLDLHASCRYPTDQAATVCGNGISIGNVKDVWTRLSKEFKNEPTIYAYDLMNEPYAMTSAVWQRYSQAMVDAIRANGDDKLLWVEGIEWSSAGDFAAVNGPPWIKDPARRIVYSAHEYPPTSDGGAWKSPDYSAADEAWIPRTQKFYDWCKQYGQTCSIGEGSVASDRLTSTWPKWNDLLDRWYAAADAAGVTVTYYAATSAWDQPNRAFDNATSNSVSLSTMPGTVAEINRALSPAAIIAKHPSR